MKKLLVLVMLLLGWATPVYADDPDPEALYAKNCAACHGENGEGRVGPSFAHLDDHSDAEIYQVIAEGRLSKGMPAWENSLTPEEITVLIGYLRTLGETAPHLTPTPTPGTVPPGEELPPIPTGFYSSNPPLLAIALLGLVVGSVWLTYGWVAYQLLRIFKSK